jgi:hypothetical protein
MKMVYKQPLGRQKSRKRYQMKENTQFRIGKKWTYEECLWGVENGVVRPGRNISGQ